MTASTSSLPPRVQRPYGKIVLTLENCILPLDKPTPSESDGLDPETEQDLRILGCELIQTAGILLRLPQVAMATGQVLFQRFFYSKSFVRHSMEATAMSCVLLASKIEEAPRRVRDVINVFHHIKQVRAQKPITPVILDQNYINLKTQVIKAERRVLKELGFCVHVKHPHKLIVMYLKFLDLESHQAMVQTAWNYMNDSFRTTVFVRYQPETIACACIYLAARHLNYPLPTAPPWYEVFSVSEEDILNVCYRIMALYQRAKPNIERLEQAVEQLKEAYQEQKRRDKSGQGTPPTVVTVDRNNGSHNAWGGFISRALPIATGDKNGAGPSHIGGSTSGTTASSSSKYSSPKKRSHTRSRSSSPSQVDDRHSKRRKHHSSRSPSAKKKATRDRYSRSSSMSPSHRSSKHSKKSDSRKYDHHRTPTDHYLNGDRRKHNRGGGGYYDDRYERDDRYYRQSSRTDKYRKDKYK